MALYAIHGTLHLAGFDDAAPASRRRMRAAERKYLGIYDRLILLAGEEDLPRIGRLAAPLRLAPPASRVPGSLRASPRRRPLRGARRLRAFGLRTRLRRVPPRALTPLLGAR